MGIQCSGVNQRSALKQIDYNHSHRIEKKKKTDINETATSSQNLFKIDFTLFELLSNVFNSNLVSLEEFI